MAKKKLTPQQTKFKNVASAAIKKCRRDTGTHKGKKYAECLSKEMKSGLKTKKKAKAKGKRRR